MIHEQYAEDRPLFTYFEASALQWPSRTALDFGHTRVTYSELREIAQMLALGIHNATDSPGRIGLVASQTMYTYGAYLGILHAGHTVIPIDPDAPAGRTVDSLTAANAGIVIADGCVNSALAEMLAVNNIQLLVAKDILRSQASRLETRPRFKSTFSGSPAYILFTSGSTGRPKGVPISARNVCSFVEYVRDRYRLTPDCRMSQTFKLTFDPSVFDMFAAFSSGATLVVPRPREVITPIDYVANRSITHWFSVPSVISICRKMRTLHPGSMPELSLSLFIGEPLTIEQAYAWASAAPNSAVENLYGPTELTVACSQYRLPKDPSEWPATSNRTVPIGDVYPHLEATIVGDDGRLAAEGELCIRGPQMFGGYLHSADNHARFVEIRDGNARVQMHRPRTTEKVWYRTGDRVRREQVGLVHLGRLDRQVKIRGHRIELGEIEGVLRQYPGVIHCAAVAVEAAGGWNELHVALTGSSSCSTRELNTFARSMLPDHMVPSGYLWLEAMPTNSSGKIDYRLIVSLFSSGSSADEDGVL